MFSTTDGDKNSKRERNIAVQRMIHEKHDSSKVSAWNKDNNCTKVTSVVN